MKLNYNLNESFVGLIPGVVFLFAVGLVGWYIGSQIPFISYLLVCIGIGLFISNATGLPKIIERGIYGTHKIWLEAGIMVLGARILLADLLDVGPILLGLVILFLAIGLVLTQILASRFGLDQKFGSILASGVSVCGVSAVVATSGGIKPKEKHIAYAIATVLILDVITVFSYPLIGSLLSVPSEIFGAWAGISMFSTGTTVAAGFAYSEAAGQLATMTKMARNVFIGIWALLFSVYYVRKGVANKIENKASYLWSKFPKFIIGFVFIMILVNICFIGGAEIEYMENAYSWLFIMAFVGLGYNIDVHKMAKTGFKPLLVVIIVFLIMSVLSFGLLNIIF